MVFMTRKNATATTWAAGTAISTAAHTGHRRRRIPKNLAEIQAVLAHHQKGTGQEDHDFIEQNLRPRRLKLRNIGRNGKRDGPHHREPLKDAALKKLFAAFQNRLFLLRGHDDVFPGQQSCGVSNEGGRSKACDDGGDDNHQGVRPARQHFARSDTDIRQRNKRDDRSRLQSRKHCRQVPERGFP